MPRPRTFDPDDALDAVMLVFWRKGYAETSYDDLVSETGVSRKGLYTAFGDKRALFLRALQRYRATVAKGYLAEMSKPGATKDDLVAGFRSMIAFGATDAGRLGCFMANTSVDEISEDPKVRKAVQDHFDRMASCFGTAMLNSGYGRRGGRRACRLPHRCVPGHGRDGAVRRQRTPDAEHGRNRGPAVRVKNFVQLENECSL